MEQSPSWEAGGHLANEETPHLSRDQRFITLPTTAYSIWEPVLHLVTLRFFSCHTVKPYAEPIPYSSREAINIKEYPQQIFHSFFESYQVRNIILHYRLGTSVCITVFQRLGMLVCTTMVVPQVRNISTHYDGSTGSECQYALQWFHRLGMSVCTIMVVPQGRNISTHYDCSTG